MPLMSLLLDLIAAGAYFFQVHHQATPIIWLGTIVQIIIFLTLLVFTFGYRGQRKDKHDWGVGYRYYTIPYGLIVISMVLNGLLLFLYILNVTGINNVIFSNL